MQSSFLEETFCIPSVVHSHLLKLCIFNDTLNVFEYVCCIRFINFVFICVCYNGEPLRLSVCMNKGTTYLLTYLNSLSWRYASENWPIFSARQQQRFCYCTKFNCTNHINNNITDRTFVIVTSDKYVIYQSLVIWYSGNTNWHDDITAVQSDLWVPA